MSLSQRLQQQGQFLSLSLQSPELFQSPLAFKLSNGTEVQIAGPGFIAFSPAQTGSKALVLSSGIHGNETAPIEICADLVADLLTEKREAVQPTLFIFGNLDAMRAGSRFVDENLNRLFCGAHQNGEANLERRRAAQIESVLADFYQQHQGLERCHYDLHTAIRASVHEKFAVYPFLHGGKHSRAQLAFLAACGVHTILLSEAPTTTFSYHSSRLFGAHAFTVELGRVAPFGQNDMRRFAEARAALTALVCQAAPNFPTYDATQMNLFTVSQVINKTQADFALHFADDTPNFTEFGQDDLLASETGAEYRAKKQGEAIVFPNAKVALGQRALLTVVPGKLTE